jgi:hypothetical protein
MFGSIGKSQLYICLLTWKQLKIRVSIILRLLKKCQDLKLQTLNNSLEKLKSLMSLLMMRQCIALKNSEMLKSSWSKSCHLGIHWLRSILWSISFRGRREMIFCQWLRMQKSSQSKFSKMSMCTSRMLFLKLKNF